MNTMSLNHSFFVLIQNFCTWSLLHGSLLLFYAHNHVNVTIHNEGVYIPFSLSHSKLSNLCIKATYQHKYLLSPSDESGSLKF
jgi:hypothetical protein